MIRRIRRWFERSPLLDDAPIITRPTSVVESRSESQILNHIEDGIVLVERSSVGWLNPAAKRMFPGLATPNGRSLVELVRDHRIDGLESRARQTGLEQAAEIELVGPRRTLAVRAVPLNAEQTLLLFQDVSRVRYLETVRQQFVANLAHDMRTPLSGLDLAAQTLARELTTHGDARVLVGRVLEESQRLQGMLRNLTQLAALDAEGVQVERVEFDAGLLLDSLAERNRQQTQQRGLGLRISRFDEPLAAIGDRAKTEQALQNVIDNAIKFTKRGEIELTAANREGKVEIAVRDTGPGIPPRDLPRIFERFYKVDRSRGNQPGSGLGLSIARHLIELQGGTITAESTPGMGTTIRIRVPLKP